MAGRIGVRPAFFMRAEDDRAPVVWPLTSPVSGAM